MSNRNGTGSGHRSAFQDMTWVRFHGPRWRVLVETGWFTHSAESKRMFIEDPIETWALMVKPWP